jgi:SpoIIAA-like
LTVEVMDEGRGDALGFKLSGKITDEDYKNMVTPKLEEALKPGRPIRLLVYIDETYKGLEVGAMWDDAKFGLSHLGDVVRGRFEKVALVGGPNWQRRVGEIFGHLIPGEVKAFEAEELEQAWGWVKR